MMSKNRGLIRQSSGYQHWSWLCHLHDQCWRPPHFALLTSVLRRRLPWTLDVMVNTVEKAAYWTQFMADRSELRNGPLLLEHFKAGKITRLCDCGCNSYDIDVPADIGLAPLLPESGNSGCALQLEFYTGEEQRTIGIAVFVKDSGYLAGIDVDYCGNSYPMPDVPTIVEPPFSVTGVLKNE